VAQPDLEIIGLLQARLAAMSPAPAGGIAWENRAFTPLTTAPWVRVSHAFVDAEPMTWLSNGTPQIRETGLLLLDCFAPENAGPEVGAGLAAQVRQWFHPGLVLAGATVSVRIDRATRAQGRVGAGTPDDPVGYFSPVTVSWRTYYDAG
jgi:hypothetical protein